MSIDGRREELREVRVSHPGLRLGPYWPDLADDEAGRENRRRWLDGFAGGAVTEAVDAYRPFVRRRAALLGDRPGALVFTMRTDGRLAFGHGDESVNEIGIRLHHVFGMPVVPGSALKGVARAHLRHRGQAALAGALFGAEPRKEGDAARVVVHDAWWEPPPGGHRGPADGPFSLDTITVHHPGWYQRKKGVLPADWDSPTPLAHLCAVGRFQFAVESPHARVAAFVRDLLMSALAEDGVGGRTLKGYGRFQPVGAGLAAGARAPGAAAAPAAGVPRGAPEDRAEGRPPAATGQQGPLRVSIAWDPGRRKFWFSMPVGARGLKVDVDGSMVALFGREGMDEAAAAARRDSFAKTCQRKGTAVANVWWVSDGGLPKITRIDPC